MNKVKPGIYRFIGRRLFACSIVLPKKKRGKYLKGSIRLLRSCRVVFGFKRDNLNIYFYPDKEEFETELDYEVDNNWDEQKDSLVVDWKRVRRILEHEDGLIIERIKILFAYQTLLSASYYFLFNLNPDTTGYRYGQLFLLLSICVLGFCMTIFLFLGLKAAAAHQKRLKKWWYSRVGYVRRGFKGRNSERAIVGVLPFDMRRQPPIAGKDPFFIEKRRRFPYSLVAASLFAPWVLGTFVAISVVTRDEIKVSDPIKDVYSCEVSQGKLVCTVEKSKRR